MAVNPKISSIIAAAYDKMAVMSLAIIHNFDDGYGASQKQQDLQTRLMKTNNLVWILSKFVEFDDDGNYVAVHRLTDTTVNDILKYLIKVADLNNYPIAPKIFYRGHPRIRTEGSQGTEGPEGPTGPTGGGRDFSELAFNADTFIDRFALTDSKGARWDYVLYGSLGRRSGTIRAIWSDDGLTISETSDIGTDDIGTTIGNVSFVVELDGTDIVLKADITSGTWNVVGTRYWIPNLGNYVPPPTGLLPNAQIYVGDSTNNAVARTPGGVLAMTNTGVFSFVAGSIVNADVNASAAIAYSKLNLTGGIVNADVNASAAIAYSKLNLSGGIVNADINASAAIARTKIAVGTAYRIVVNSATGALSEAAITANRAIVSDANGLPTASATTATEIGYVNGVTSPIQTQINTKQDIITGAATTVTTANLTANRLLVSDASGKIAVSTAGSGAGAPGGATNELQKNGGGVFSGTGLFSTSDGNVILGTSAMSGTKTISKAKGTNVSNLILSAPDGIVSLTQGDGITISAGAGYSAGGVGGSILLSSGTGFSGSSYGNVQLSAKNGNIYLNVSTGELGNIAMFGNGSLNFHDGERIIYIGNRNAVATGNPSNGVFLYGESGDLMLHSSDGSIVNLSRIVGSDGVLLKTKVVAIGDWNMTLTPLVGVTHGISDFTKIRSVTATIRNDANTVLIPYSDNFDAVTSTEVSIGTSAPFSTDANYNATAGYNRGWVTITYEA